MREIHEVLPGIFHWHTFHEGIAEDVHSLYIEATDPAVLIDPRMPKEGLEWFLHHKRPEHAYLTNRHHYRHSGRFQEAFGTEVWCHEAGLHEYTHGEKLRPFRHGETLPGGIEALEVGVLCPEETALYIPVGAGAMALGDAVVRVDNALDFVPDELMGEDPEGVKRGLREAFARLLDRRFDALFFAHGEPWLKGGKEVLRAFLEGRLVTQPA